MGGIKKMGEKFKVTFPAAFALAALLIFTIAAA